MPARGWINPACLILAMLFASLPVAAAPAGSDAGAEKELQQNEAILTDTNSLPQARDQAAQRLVSRARPEADQVLLRVLNDLGNREARLSVAKALAGTPSLKPNPVFVAPLLNLLGDDPELTGAAARALAGYKDKEGDRARSELTQFVTNRRQTLRSRTAAIRAMGKLVDKRTAQTLIELLRDENALVRDAAVDALTEMTGLTDYGRDRQRWFNWWREALDRNEAEWATDLLVKNAARAGKLESRITQARRELVELITDEYQRAPAGEQLKRIQTRFQSESEDARWAAVAVLYKDIRERGGINTAPELLHALRDMVADSSGDVRAEAARALAEANDAGSLDALLAQASQEKDPDALAAILRALGPMQDLRAIKPLLSGLGADSSNVARAAAESVKSLAPALRNPANKDQISVVAQRLLERLSLTADPSAESLRASIVEALAALGDPSALSAFQKLCISDRESAQVRRYAVRGIAAVAAVGNRDVGTIVEVLRDADRGVRLEALDALAKLATFEYAEAIGRLLSDRNERDSSVRDRAWEVLSTLFEKAPSNDLPRWADRFRGDTDLDHKRRLRIFQVLESKLASPAVRDRLAACRQNIGIELLRLERPEEAAAKFRDVLEYWKGVNAGAKDTDYPMQLFMKAMLRGKKYADASKFAAESIQASSGNAATLWLVILEEIERLKRDRDYDSVLLLLEEVKKAPLSAAQKSQLPSIEESVRELKKKQAASGARTWVRQPKAHEHAGAAGTPAA